MVVSACTIEGEFPTKIKIQAYFLSRFRCLCCPVVAGHQVAWIYVDTACLGATERGRSDF